VLKKSSDIGVAKLTLSLPSNSLVDMYQKVGFGQSTQSGFPGEGAGVLPDNLKARPFVLATLSFGYSISVTLLQLAQSYAVLASKGVMRPVTFLKVDKQVEGKRVLPEELSEQVLYLLESVLDTGGTGKRARVSGYRVAGKTGTSHIASAGGYYKDRHCSSFVGIAPVSDPEFVVAVVVKNPKKGGYHGGRVTAPVFANVMNDTLRVFGVPLDDVDK
jgi:cell division protein FtsI (penicillin-binding protein 3)